MVKEGQKGHVGWPGIIDQRRSGSTETKDVNTALSTAIRTLKPLIANGRARSKVVLKRSDTTQYEVFTPFGSLLLSMGIVLFTPRYGSRESYLASSLVSHCGARRRHQSYGSSTWVTFDLSCKQGCSAQLRADGRDLYMRRHGKLKSPLDLVQVLILVW